MSEEMYWIEGDVQIPEEQRDLVNHTVLRVLQICGARKREKMILSGKEVGNPVSTIRHPVIFRLTTSAHGNSVSPSV